VLSEKKGNLLATDWHLFELCVFNLLNNSIKYTQEGKIELTLDLQVINQNLHKLILSVQDSGVGITRERLNSIFTEFKELSDN
jgi:signal transduction histidine kinase